MVAVPDRIHSTPALIYEQYERRREAEEARPYLGASILGHECARYLWQSFRWVGREAFSGRILRLFETGQLQEPRLVADLRSIGVTVSEVGEDGRQWGVEFCGGHGRGHLDAALHGLPEAPETWHVAEFKTHADKSFRELVAKGVRGSKPMHYAQMQVYMGCTGMERGFYCAVNKNDDTIYTERIEFDRDEFARLMQRAESIVFAAEPPPRISDDPAWWACKTCAFHEHCHGTAAPQPSCRSCAHSTPTRDGAWRCERHEKPIPVDEQRVGCPEHRVIPILLANWAEMVDGDGTNVRYRSRMHGGEFVNGDAPDGFTSAELAAANDKALFGRQDEITTMLREEFGGRIVEAEHDYQVGDVVRWRTFENGTRHLEHRRGDRFLSWVPQTTEWLVRAGEVDPVGDMPDDLEAVYGAKGAPAENLFTSATESLFK